MQTKIIAGFPGVGKSYLTKNAEEMGLKVSDSDSSQFSWIIVDGKRVRNPEFPNNYIEHIKSLIGEVDVILTSTHKKVRDALKENHIDYTLIYPDTNCKEIYMENYKNRGNDELFLKLMEENWDIFLEELREEEGAAIKFVLIKNAYLKDIFYKN